VKADDKNIDKICDVWYNYSISRIIEDTDEHWSQTKSVIKKLMNKEKCAITR
jgi:Ribonuclease G/E